MKTSLSARHFLSVLVALSAVILQPLPAHADYPSGYCTWWAAQQFNHSAPSPGCNWSANAQDWVGAANAKGWATTGNLTSTTPGAIVVWSGGIFGHVAYVTGVNANGISISEMNFGPIWTDYANGKTNYFGVTTTASLSWAQVSQRTSSLKFAGYILPFRQGQPSPLSLPSVLGPGGVLLAGQAIASSDSRAVLVMQSDGNLVLYERFATGSMALWASNTSGIVGAVAVMQTDGNFVIYGPNGFVKGISNTYGTQNPVLVMQTDGNAVIYGPNGAVWSTHTGL